MLATTGPSKADDTKGFGTKIVAAVAGGAPTELARFVKNPLTRLLVWRHARKTGAYAADSPNAFVDKNDSPIFFYNGSIDALVHPKEHPTVGFLGPTALHESLKAAGVDTGLYIAKGAGHLAMVLNKKAQNAGYAFSTNTSSRQTSVLARRPVKHAVGRCRFDHPKHYNGGRGILKNVMKTSARRPLQAHRRRQRRLDRAGRRVRPLPDQGGTQDRRPVDRLHRLRRQTPHRAGVSTGPSRRRRVRRTGAAHQDALEARALQGFPATQRGGHRRILHQNAGRIPRGLGQAGRRVSALGQAQPELAALSGFRVGTTCSTTMPATIIRQPSCISSTTSAKRSGNRSLVVIGELGNDGPKAGKSMLAIRAAQKAAAKALARTAFVPTTQFARPASRPMSPTGTTGTATPKLYFIGDALGQALLKLNDK